MGCNLPAVGFRSTHELMLNVLKDVELDFDMCLLFSEVCMKFFNFEGKFYSSLKYFNLLKA